MTKAGNGTGGKAWERQGGASQHEGFDPEAEALLMLDALSPGWRPAATTGRPNRQGLPTAEAVPRHRNRKTVTEAESSRMRNTSDAQSVRPSNVDNVDKRDALRRAAREWLEAHPVWANAKSQERYRRVAEMMERTGERPETATNANTFQGRRAAAFLWIAEELERWFDEGGDPNHVESLLERAAELAALKWSAIKPPKPTARRSKANLSDMPPDWKARMFERATDRLRLPLALLEVGGMRPEEIGRPVGVEVTMLTPEGEGVRFRLFFEGAKVGGGHGVAAGHPTGWQRRELIVEAAGGRADWLADAIIIAGGTLLYRTDSERLKDNVRSLAKRLWPRRRAETRPSAYSYRHAFSSAQKAAGTDAATLAVAMGHRAERTQGGYGRPSRTATPDVRLVSARAFDDRAGSIPRPDRRRSGLPSKP